MRVEYDRDVCGGWFQCVQHWDAFEMDMLAGKADLEGSEETDSEIFVREVPADKEEDAIAAAESCPVDAIEIFDGDELVAPTED